ncbi:MAG TPA: EAL domain-containing protein [Candidatus Methylomirabilis sp.]|nr:EAL domain-containing protein [Candidatus Methylomirabilis sp.]
MKSTDSSFTRQSKTGFAPDTSRGWIVVFIVAILGLATLTLLQVYAERQARENDALRLDQELVDVWHRLELGMEQRINTVEALQGFMLATRKPPDLAEFDNFAATLMQIGGGAKGYAYGDAAGVLRYFYPRAGNRNAIGLNMYSRPDASFLRKAVEERRTTVGDPVQVIQDGLSVVVRAPLFRNGRPVGHVQGVFDVTKLVERASDILDAGMALQLEDAQGQIFFGATAPLAWSRSVTVQAGDNHWRLRVAWKAGPPGSSWLTPLLIWLGGGLLLASLMYMLYRVQSQARVLARAVDERTAALQESQRTLSTLMNNLPGAVYRCLNDPNWTLEFISDGIRELTGYAPDDFVRTRRVTYAQLIHSDDREQVWRDVQTAVADKRPFQLLYRVATADGRTRWVWEQGEGVFSPSGELLRLEGFITDVTERVLAERALRHSEDRLRKIFNASAMIISVSRLEDGRFLDVNPAFLRTGGWTREEVIGRTSRDLDVWVGGEDRARLIERMRREGAIHELELPFRMKSGEVRNLLCGIERIRIDDVDCLLLVGQDITERKKAETQMQKLSRALEQTADAVQITNRDGVIEYVNPTFEQVTGYAFAEAVGRKTNLLKSGRQGPRFYENLWKTILAGNVFNDVFVNRRKDGSLYYEEKTITPLKDVDGRIAHFVATGKDITERMETQERLAYMAQHDPLTELPNRTLLLDRLKQSLAGARWRQRRTAVLFVDLDRFKTINDTLGHEVGDRLLQQLAARFQASVREGDTVARFGGDEFVILLDDVASADDVAGVAQKVLQALAPPFEVDHHTLYVTASIGMSLFPNDGEDASTLLKNADIAMYRAKELGKNTYQFYSADMSARAFERLTLESSLRRALDQGEFRLYYQPQFDVETGAIVGVEALLRWQHPEFGLVMPSDFIPLLEETGLIVPAGEWALQTACAQIAAWHAQGWRRLRLSVNLSPRQIQGHDLTATVRRAVEKFDGDPARLELEITEGVLVRHAPAAVEALEALNALGVRMAVDDFGTGYSSLSYLRRLPIDTLKIDRAFVRDIPRDPDDSAITAAIIALAQTLKLDMIAEGVETEAQRDFLHARGCRVMQGFLFSRPQPPEEIQRLLQVRKPD